MILIFINTQYIKITNNDCIVVKARTNSTFSFCLLRRHEKQVKSRLFFFFPIQAHTLNIYRYSEDMQNVGRSLGYTTFLRCTDCRKQWLISGICGQGLVEVCSINEVFKAVSRVALRGAEREESAAEVFNSERPAGQVMRVRSEPRIDFESSPWHWSGTCIQVPITTWDNSFTSITKDLF